MEIHDHHIAEEERYSIEVQISLVVVMTFLFFFVFIRPSFYSASFFYFLKAGECRKIIRVLVEADSKKALKNLCKNAL